MNCTVGSYASLSVCLSVCPSVCLSVTNIRLDNNSYLVKHMQIMCSNLKVGSMPTSSCIFIFIIDRGATRSWEIIRFAIKYYLKSCFWNTLPFQTFHNIPQYIKGVPYKFVLSYLCQIWPANGIWLCRQYSSHCITYNV